MSPAANELIALITSVMSKAYFTTLNGFPFRSKIDCRSLDKRLLSLVVNTGVRAHKKISVVQASPEIGIFGTAL